MIKIIPLTVIAFIFAGALLCSCDSRIIDNNPCDTCQNPCDTCLPCDTCDTTLPCDTCDTTKGDPDSLAHAFTWTEFSISGERNLTGVLIINENKIYALGDYFYEFDGVDWELLPIRANGNPLGGLADMSLFGFGGSDYWIFMSNRAYHINDNQIYGVRYDIPTDGNIHAAWGTSSTDMFFVGNYGAVTHFDGTHWTKMERVTNDHLTSVWGTSYSDVWAGGLNRTTGESALIHYDGNSWTDINLSTVGQFECAGCDGVTSVWAIDSAGQKKAYVGGSFFYRKTGNGQWTNDGDLPGNKIGAGDYSGITSIRGNKANDLMCAGDWGFVSHWNGKTWRRYDELFAPGNPSYATGAMDFKGNTACVVGTKSGQSWIAIGRRKP